MDRGIDAVVVGGGIIGSCVALSLQQSGQNTLLIDQYDPPHTQGSSGGHARITRLANFGPPQLTPILQDAMKRWKQLSDKVQQELISPAPMLVVGNVRSEVDNMGKSLQKTGTQPNWLTPTQTNQKYKTRYSDDYTMFEDTSAGVIRADRCINAVLNEFHECGGKIEGGWKVDGVDVDGEYVVVKGSRGLIKSKYLLICAGPWANTLLNLLNIHLPLQPIKTKAYLFENRDFPHASILDITTRNYFYGLPSMESRTLYKASYHAGDFVSPDSQSSDLSYLKDRVVSYVNKMLPLHQPKGEENCWYMESPDKEFVLDRHPKHSNIMYAAGFSGTGFKAAPTIGHILASEVIGKQHDFDMTPFRANRFTNTSFKSKM